MSSGHRFGRRSLLQLGTALFAAPIAGGRVLDAQAPAAPGAAANAVVAGTPVFAARLVPEGAECRVALVTDHHYWPEHKENWGGGAQITSNTDRRMPDLVATLNAARPDLSIHSGDVISAGGSFFPTPEEYAKQLAFLERFFGGLTHPFVPAIGNHETLDAHYASHAQLDAWRQRFGSPFREHDCKGWRLLTLNSMLPNPDRRHGAGDSFGNVYGLDDEQLRWLRARLTDAAGRGLKAIVIVHVPPRDWVNAAAFEEILVSSGCVKAVVCGHWHRNSLSLLGGIPVLVRSSNVETPFGYHMIHLYPDGRIIIVQHSQHFPYDEFVSAGFAQGKQGAETDRYVTIGGASHVPLSGLRLLGDDAEAEIVDGHLRVGSRAGRATMLIDTAALDRARLTFTAVKARGDRMGAIALAAADGTGGIEATVTSRYSSDGKVYLATAKGGKREVLARSWFNIADDIAYRVTVECRDGRVTASWANMLTLETTTASGSGGHFGFFVERGGIFVTDVTLERLA